MIPAPPSLADALHEKRIIIVEDDYFLADYISSSIQRWGGRIDGPYPSNEAALAHLASGDDRPDAATLNIRLQDGDSYPVADRLQRLGVPFLFASANEATSLPSRFARTPIVTKPFTPYQIGLALTVLLESGRAAPETHA